MEAHPRPQIDAASLVSGDWSSRAVVMHADAYLFAVLLWDVVRE